jgi:hypothetical protein
MTLRPQAAVVGANLSLQWTLRSGGQQRRCAVNDFLDEALELTAAGEEEGLRRIRNAAAASAVADGCGGVRENAHRA